MATEGSFQEPAGLERYRRYLIVLARASIDPRLRPRLDASDVVQQTLLEAHKCASQLGDFNEEQVAGWLRRALANNITDALRGLARAKRDVGRQRSLDEDYLARSSERVQSWLAADQSSPSEHAHRAERALWLAEALLALPEAQREALILQYWHGWSLAQIAAEMGRTPAAVAGLLKRGMQSLRERFGTDGDEPASLFARA
jgi:RNA polymerase sigma-70 factor (ECF subfamily)